MKRSSADTATGEVWATTSGSLVVGVIVLLLLLTAFAGWPWVAQFLDSGAAAWVQALGSIAAIFVALGVVQRQHALELRRRRREEQLLQLSRLRALRTIFFTAASVCERVAKGVNEGSGIYGVRSEDLHEARSRLLAVDPLHVPNDHGLLLIVERCLMRLRDATRLVAELEQPREKLLHTAIELVVKGAALECWLGFKQATRLEINLCGVDGVDADPLSFDELKLARESLYELREKSLYKEGLYADGVTGVKPESVA